MRTFVLFGAKHFGFFEIYGVTVSARIRERGGRASADKGPIFRESLLWTAHNWNFDKI